ncbi:regulator of G-protein signaling 4-like [Brienomyrus brachyistius]|uniref:regulator of G-protein signaling 4-like n=1 Tax=Brienomyrus brachyistius TaxID=42636 RepID=UPI0020B367CF|nr:regulator of G-protein signaling 4-like [Brienomyrus brachyistius]
MCKGLAALPATCLRSAKDIKHKIGFLLQKPEIQQRQSAAKDSNENATAANRVDPEEVKKWGESLESLVSHEVGVMTFETFLRTEFSQENLEFWVACEDYKTNTPPEKLSSKAREIFDMYVEVESPKEVNLDSTTKEETRRNLENINPTNFEEAQRKIFLLMEKDSYRRFIKSKLFLDILQQPEKRNICGIMKRGRRNSPDLAAIVD